MAKVMCSGLRAAHACGLAGHALAAWRAIRLRPDGPCDCSLTDHAYPASQAGRPPFHTPAFAASRTARARPPPPGRTGNASRLPGQPPQPQEHQPGKRRTAASPSCGADPSRAASAPLALWVEGRRCGRPLEGRKRTQEQHALQELWAGEQGHSPSGFAMTLPFPLS